MRAGARRDELAAYWDDVVREAVAGGTPHLARRELRRWFSAFRGTGKGTVEAIASPEPYVGPLATAHGDPRLVALGLNPGQSDLRFQGPGGVFAREYEATRGFSSWAVTEPYLRDPWRSEKGRNLYHENLRTFAQRWLDDREVRSRDVLVFELYPWHSAGVTAPITPDVDLVERFIWQPISEIAVHEVFAFGSPWQRVADRLGLAEVQVDVQFGDRTRRVRLFELPSGQRLIVSWHQASNSPPGAADVATLRQAVRGRQDVQAAHRPVSSPKLTEPGRGIARTPRKAPADGADYARFWSSLTERIRRERAGWKVANSKGNDLPLFSPLPQARIKCNFPTQGLRVELLLGSSVESVNTWHYTVLTRHLGELQTAFGSHPLLVTEPLEGKTQARLAAYLPGTIDEQRQWPEYERWFIDVVMRLDEALREVPRISAEWGD